MKLATITSSLLSSDIMVGCWGAAAASLCMRVCTVAATCKEDSRLLHNCVCMSADGNRRIQAKIVSGLDCL